MKKNTLIFIITYLAYTSIYIARLNLSMASPGFVESGIMDSAQIGILGSVFSIIFAVGRLINGGISDKQPPYRMISIGLLLAGLSNIAVGFFPPFIGMVILWGANAFAQSMLWSSVLCVISAIYDEQTAKKKTSYMVTSVAAGNILGILLNTYIITKFGLNFAFIIPGGLTLILSGAVLLTLKSVRPVYSEQNKHASVFQLFKNNEIRLITIPAMLHGVIKDNISLWMAVYFVDKFNINLSQSAYFVLFIPAMGFIGRLLYPVCYKICKEQEHKVSAFSFIACTLLAIPLCLNNISPVVAVLCLSLIYTFISIINTSLLSIYPIHYLSTGNVASVSGMLDFATYGGAGIGSSIYGIVIKYFGYSPMYVSWVLISFISLIIIGIIIQKNKSAQ